LLFYPSSVHFEESSLHDSAHIINMNNVPVICSAYLGMLP